MWKPCDPGGNPFKSGTMRNPSFVSSNPIVPIAGPTPFSSILLIVTRVVFASTVTALMSVSAKAQAAALARNFTVSPPGSFYDAKTIPHHASLATGLK
jgi:hypothetical protein